MDWWIWILLALTVIIIVQAIMKRSGTQKKLDNLPEIELEVAEKKIQYRRKSFLTENEKHFLTILHALDKYNMIVVPQVNLATVIQKVGEFRYQNELYRNIDFAVFDSTYNLLLLIELNDASHQQSARRARDIKVKELTSQAGIKLMTFYTNKPNLPDYVITRILSELGVST